MYDKDYQKQYYQRNKGRIKKRNRARRGEILQYNRGWRKRLKKEVLTYYGEGKLACVRCGFSDIRALSIDHISGRGRMGVRKGFCGKDLHSWLKSQGYPLGYQTLCMNCQFIKREENQEYYDSSRCIRADSLADSQT